jgi:peptide/nickel transport system substrate-binding protein
MIVGMIPKDEYRRDNSIVSLPRLIKNVVPFWILLLGSLVISGCTLFSVLSPSPDNSTSDVPDISTLTPVIPSVTNTPAFTPTVTPIPRVLTICLGAEPDTLYLYGGHMLAQSQILSAIYDGPIDNREFGYQPVILEKIPNLSDGDAVIQPVMMGPGEQVVDIYGAVVTLEQGEIILPSGCSTAACAIEYDGVSEIQMEQLVVTFKLLPDLKWSDGENLTAQDSVYSFGLAADPDTPDSKYTVEHTAAYEALDETTIRWTGLPGYRDQSYFLNFWSPLPEHLWGKYSAAELLEAEESVRYPQGWGPYMIADWVIGDHISLWMNPNYHRAAEGFPNFDKLIYRFIGTDSETNLAALASGECDFLDQEASLELLGVEIDTTLDLESSNEINAYFSTGTVWEHVDFGIQPLDYDDGYSVGVDRPDFFSDPRTRQAIAMCIDRQGIVDELLHGLSDVVDTYLPPRHPLFNPEVVSYSYDIEAANALLNEVGWIDHDGLQETARLSYGVWNVVENTPLAFTLVTTTAVQRQQVAQSIIDSLEQCGIQVDLVTLPADEFYAPGPEGLVFGRRFDLAQYAWLSDANPRCELWVTEQIPGDPNILNEQGKSIFLYGWGGLNATGYSNPEYDAACRAALGALPGELSYQESHWLAQELFAMELPSLPLYMRLKLAVTRPDMCGFEMDSTASSELWNLEALDYAEGCP